MEAFQNSIRSGSDAGGVPDDGRSRRAFRAISSTVGFFFAVKFRPRYGMPRRT